MFHYLIKEFDADCLSSAKEEVDQWINRDEFYCWVMTGCVERRIERLEKKSHAPKIIKFCISPILSVATITYSIIYNNGLLFAVGITILLLSIAFGILEDGNNKSIPSRSQIRKELEWPKTK